MGRIGVLLEGKNGEIKPAQLGALAVARQDACGDVCALVWAQGASSLHTVLREHGADKIVEIGLPAAQPVTSPETQAGAIAAAMDAFRIDILLGTAGATGRDLLARTASLLGATAVLDCLDIDLASGIVKKSHFSGRATAILQLRGRPWVLGIRPNTVSPRVDPRAGELVSFPAPVERACRLFVREIRQGTAGGQDVSEAEIILTGGRAIGAAENFSLLRECAAVLGAAVGATRAAVDAGYAPHAMQVGQTGKTVSPRLYIACGVSGSVQHFAGMKTSKVIVAVNNDPDAPIFGKCDIGLVGDLFAVVPALTKALRSGRG